MRVAIAAPSPVPFGIGGAENFWHGLHTALNATPGVQAELIKVPADERTLKALTASYAAFAALNLDHFDTLITTKYPAWMIRHPHHTVYVQHTLRGLYDTYPTGLPREAPAATWRALGLDEPVHRVLTGQAPRESLLDVPLAALAAHIAQAVARLPDDHPALDFPGPVARGLIHLLDALAMHPTHIRQHAAIARTVRERADYFPPDVPVAVHHHPAHLTGFHTAAPRYLFCASRLDPAKRLDLLIQAYQRSAVDWPLHIAGAGPDEQRLRALAGDHPGIVFRGRLTDAELVGAYAEAVAVVFVPHQEDYGLITLEAMLAGKPVITTHDGGGTTELVRHGETGLIVAPDPEALAQALRDLVADPAHAARLGQQGRARAAGITWPRLIDALIAPLAPPAPSTVGAPGAVLVINTFPLWPAHSGGRQRLLGLYGALARHRPVTFVCLDESLPHEALAVDDLRPGLRVYRVGPSQAWLAARDAWFRRLGVSASDLAVAAHPELLPHGVTLLAALGRQAELVICAHPYGFPLWQRTGLQRPLVLEAHNAEADMKRVMYGPAQAEVADQVARVEQACLHAADLLVACTDADAAALTHLHPRASCILPNGCDFAATPFHDQAARRQIATRAGKHRPLALFMGSNHRPNVEAAETVLATAQHLPEVDFCLLGSVCQGLVLQAPLPDNVRLLGVVSDAEKQAWLALADLGLNPMTSGGGSNLKLADMAASGCRLVSTAFGARGSGLLAGVHHQEAEASAAGVASACLAALAWPASEADTRTRSARAMLAASSDWASLGERLHQALQGLTPRA